MARIIRRVELLLAALAVATGAAIMIPIWLGGLIAPESVGVDLAIFFGMLAVVVVGALLDVFGRGVAAKATALTLLTLGALALFGWFFISFIIEFGVPALLAFGAAALAWGRLGEQRPAALPAQ